MKKFRWTQLMIAVSLVAGVCMTTSLLHAQGQPAAGGAATAAPTPVYVAVVDLVQVMKQHPLYNVKNADLKKKFDAIEADAMSKKTTLDNEAKQLMDGSIKPDTQEFRLRSDALAKKLSDLEYEYKIKSRDHQIESATVMYELYKDIKSVVGDIATKYAIAQVVDYRKIDVNPKMDPQTVFEEMDQKIVWFSPQWDITEHVISQCYSSRGMQRPVAPPPASTAAGAPAGLQR